MAFDFCKVKRGKDDGLLRTMVPEKVDDRSGPFVTYVIRLKKTSSVQYWLLIAFSVWWSMCGGLCQF